MRVIELEGIENIRDIGGLPVAGGRRLKHGIFYRGPALVGLSEADHAILFDECGIGCVVDLRCGWELEAKPDEAPDSVSYHHIPFFDRDIIGVDYSEAAPGTRMVGHDFACEPERFYRAVANEVTLGQIRKAAHLLFENACRGIATYQHCSGGKDRTGIMTMLVLKILRAEDEAIIEDYLLTNVARDRNYDSNFARFLRLSEGDEELAHKLVMSHRAREENLEFFLEELEGIYGDLDSFISDKLGINDADRLRIIELCTEPLP